LTPEEAIRDAALRLLSFRSRSVEELRDRLERKGFSSEDVSGCLAWLQDRKYLDDSAFSRSLALDRLRFSPRSPHLMRQELVRKGVGAEIARNAVQSVLDEEEITEGTLAEAAARAWVRKQSASVQEDLLAHRFSPERERARRRLYGFLSRRGFRGDAARAGMEAGEEEARELQA
jgi:regulatory protein